MARREKGKNRSGGLLSRFLGDWEGNPSLWLVGVILAFVTVAALVLWSRFGPHIMAGGGYRLNEQSFEVTTQPPWIVVSDVKGESIVSGSLTQLNLRQKDVTVRVGQAFSMHPWVKKVNHVTKRYPSRVIVDLEYRRPVAMVEVSMMHQGQRQPGRLPIDGEGVLLPTVDFTSTTADQYLRISAGETTPVSTMSGTAWGDDRVHEAAGVAGFLLPYQQQLGFFKVIAYRGPTDGTGAVSNYFVLRTQQGASVIWGRAPGLERSGEPQAEQKMARLREYATQHGGLTTEHPGQTIDVRRAEGLQVASLSEEISAPQ